MSCEDSVGDADDPVMGCNLIRSFHPVHRLQMLCGRRRCTTGAIRPRIYVDGQIRAYRYTTESLKGQRGLTQAKTKAIPSPWRASPKAAIKGLRQPKRDTKNKIADDRATFCRHIQRQQSSSRESIQYTTGQAGARQGLALLLKPLRCLMRDGPWVS